MQKAFGILLIVLDVFWFCWSIALLYKYNSSIDAWLKTWLDTSTLYGTGCIFIIVVVVLGWIAILGLLAHFAACSLGDE
jgi:hypothetical protein